MLRSVGILEMAHCDMRGMYSFISRKISPASASKWYYGLLAKIRTLERFPERWPLAYEAADVGFDLRVILYGRRPQIYRVLFEVQNGSVIVHRVRHAAQDTLTADDF